MSCFSKNILDYFYNIQNTGRILKPEAIGRAGTKAEGTVIEFSWRVKDAVIVDARFRTFGDVNAIAISSIVATMSTGKTIDEVLLIRTEDILEQLRETKPNYLYLIDLALSALKNTYNNFIKKNGHVERKTNEFESELKSDLNKIQEGEIVEGAKATSLSDFDVDVDEDEQSYLENVNAYNSFAKNDSFESLLQKISNNTNNETENSENKGRGRPRKERTIEELEAEKNKIVRGRGRPKKERTEEELEKLNEPKGKRGRPRRERTEEELSSLENKVIRGRGRPKRERTPEEIETEVNKVIRGRGRPKKVVENENNNQITFLSTYNGLTKDNEAEINNDLAEEIDLFNDVNDKIDLADELSEKNDLFENEFDDIIEENEQGETEFDDIVEENEQGETVLNDVVEENEQGETELEDVDISSKIDNENSVEFKQLISEKKGRGRPRKERTPEEIEAEQNKVVRGRGRPKKEVTLEENIVQTESRGRGRPKKERTPEEIESEQNKVVRGRGRPRKVEASEFTNVYNQTIEGDDFVLPKKQLINQSTLDFLLNNQDEELSQQQKADLEDENDFREQLDVLEENKQGEDEFNDVDLSSKIDNENSVEFKQLTSEKKGRGRPRKERTPEEIEAEVNKVVRGRGRPKKEVALEENIVQTESRGRGRPKKERTPEEKAKLDTPKGKRGRPKKETAFVIQNVKPITYNENVSNNSVTAQNVNESSELKHETIETKNVGDNSFSELKIDKKVEKKENEYVVPTMPQNSPFAPAQNKYGVGVTSLYKPTITKTITKTTTTNYTFNEKTVTTTTTNNVEDNDEIEVEKVDNKKLNDVKTQKQPVADNTKSLKELLEEDDKEPEKVTPLSDNINNILSKGGSIQDALKALLDDEN